MRHVLEPFEVWRLLILSIKTSWYLSWPVPDLFSHTQWQVKQLVPISLERYFAVLRFAKLCSGGGVDWVGASIARRFSLKSCSYCVALPSMWTDDWELRLWKVRR